MMSLAATAMSDDDVIGDICRHREVHDLFAGKPRCAYKKYDWHKNGRSASRNVTTKDLVEEAIMIASEVAMI
jgi:hypothetical protein